MSSSRYQAPAVLRAAQILERLAASASAPTLSDLSRELGLQKSTLHGLLGSLESVGWVEKDGPRGGYRLGAGILSLCRKCGGLDELKAAALPAMQQLAESLGETVLLGTQEGNRLLIRQVVEGRKEMRVASRPGVELPLLAAATGKAAFAALPPDVARQHVESAELPAFTERSITSAGQFLSEVVKTRERGFGVDDEEYLRGVRAVAVAIPWGQRPQALLWVVGLVSSFPLETVEQAGIELKRAARRILSDLGSPVPGPSR